jgi:D-arabinose 5-phosphate isomerase GutQ
MWDGGKLIVSGVGKSGKVAEKLVATMNSLGIFTVYLHPIEALHGDLGIIRPVRSETVLWIPN